MKKSTLYLIMLAFLALMVPPAINAQNDPGSDNPTKNIACGIRFGGMISDLWFPGRPNKPVELDDPVEPLKSLTFGISMVKDYNPRFFVYADIMYERKGRGVFPVEKFPFEKYVIESFFHPQALQYLSVSTYVLFKTQGNTIISIGPGIFNALLFRQYIVFTEDSGSSSYKASSSFGWHGYDIGLGLKACITHQLSNHLVIDFQITGTTGLIPIFFKQSRLIKDLDEDLTNHSNSQKSYCLNKTFLGTLSLSYRF